MSEEDTFVEIVSLVESRDHTEAWGDDGYAVGRFQQHARFYCDWGPQREDFDGVERSWDWCFEFACRKYFKRARAEWPNFTLLQIGMYLHLHGSLTAEGWDEFYATSWLWAAAHVVKA
jgi:hypothetical protein